ncbi:PEP-CTERM sorting domain-containing protein [Coraliomargarita algicola]|uniref:PEP-CTERM sorting domain-containing protein n=1 Tax=Coraliomargarita algicola TaxID=3092156 RepID=A0ABZ0RJ96_9BACT|nr:PEP-CTERM sorting domain-containing protein [Coraliomargarita sp. J2-16]WPJ96281.1 PEP-CTERM sorting domain-containing protein [Coraliomargarita sp. J2-16]
MKLKNPKILLLAAAASLTLAQTSNANTVSVAGWEAVDLGQSGETGQFTVSVVADGNDWLYTWTKTGDLDGLGNANDTLSFQLRSSAFEGSSFSEGDVTLGTAFDYSEGGTYTTPEYQHFGPVDDIDANQSFQLSIENINYTSGDAGDETAVFSGFSSINVFANPDGLQTFYFGTVGAQVLTPASSAVTFTTVDVLTVTSTAAAKRFRDVGFSFEVAVIPEPGTYALLAGCFGLSAVVMRRRRS